MNGPSPSSVSKCLLHCQAVLQNQCFLCFPHEQHMSLVLSPSAWVYFSKAPRNLALRRVFFDFSLCFARCLHNAALRVSEPDLPFCWGMNFRGAAWLETSPRQAKTNWYMKSLPSLQKRRTVQSHAAMSKKTNENKNNITIITSNNPGHWAFFFCAACCPMFRGKIASELAAHVFWHVIKKWSDLSLLNFLDLHVTLEITQNPCRSGLFRHSCEEMAQRAEGSTLSLSDGFWREDWNALGQSWTSAICLSVPSM